MRNTIIAAVAALSLIGIQGAYAQGATGIDNGRFRQAQAEQTGVNQGSFRQAQAEQHPQYAQAEAPNPQYA